VPIWGNPIFNRIPGRLIPDLYSRYAHGFWTRAIANPGLGCCIDQVLDQKRPSMFCSLSEDETCPVLHRPRAVKAVEDDRTPSRFATLEPARQFRQGLECGSPLPLSSRPQGGSGAYEFAPFNPKFNPAGCRTRNKCCVNFSFPIQHPTPGRAFSLIITQRSMLEAATESAMVSA
jgi:hypothetical protein